MGRGNSGLSEIGEGRNNGNGRMTREMYELKSKIITNHMRADVRMVDRIGTSMQSNTGHDGLGMTIFKYRQNGQLYYVGRVTTPDGGSYDMFSTPDEARTYIKGAVRRWYKERQRALDNQYGA